MTTHPITASPGALSLVRSPTELALVRQAIDSLTARPDVRLHWLGRGACYVVDRFAPADTHPALEPVLGPAIDDASAALETAGRAAAGDLPWHDSIPGDAGRIVGRGAEEWLAWAFLPGYPLPLWLVSGMPASEIHDWVLGDVGTVEPLREVSQAAFPYDVVDRVEGLLRT